MMIDVIDRVDTLTDAQLWDVAADTHNAGEIRQQAIQRWLFPDETNPDVDPDNLGGGRLHELRQRATVLDNDELDDEGTYDGINNRNDLYTTDDKTNTDRDLQLNVAGRRPIPYSTLRVRRLAQGWES